MNLNGAGTFPERLFTVKGYRCAQRGDSMTIKDIARRSGVSISTVSRVLNDRPDVSEESRRRVQAVIDACGYIPNNSARDLVKTKSDTIGLVVRGVSNPFYTDIIRAIEAGITAGGYTMVMQQIDTGDDELKRGAIMEREKRLRGLIFLGGRFDYTRADLSPLNVPFVCCAYSNPYGTLEAEEFSSVSIADRACAHEAVRYLIERGHRRIAALVARTDDRSISQLRFQGYVKALEESGIPVEERRILCADSFDIGAASAAMARALAEGDDSTAVFAISDNMAIGAMHALRRAGRRVPEDCSVIAIDGLEVSGYIDPPLTTLCQPMEEMGRRSVEILLDVIRGAPHTHQILPTALREGGSVRTIS
jgi:LacI family transcriptional regulator